MDLKQKFVILITAIRTVYQTGKISEYLNPAKSKSDSIYFRFSDNNFLLEFFKRTSFSLQPQSSTEKRSS